METFNGPIFHTARWDHSVSYKDKNIVSYTEAPMSQLNAFTDIEIVIGRHW
jgi:hypothetical protein